MSRIENQPSDQLTVGKPHDDVAVEMRTDTQLLNEKELEAVNGGVMVALGGPDTRPQSGHTCWIRVSSLYAGAGAGSV